MRLVGKATIYMDGFTSMFLVMPVIILAPCYLQFVICCFAGVLGIFWIKGKYM